MSASGKLNRKQEVLIAALLTEPTHAAAATRAGVSEATLHRWLHLPAFRDEYRFARRAVVETAVGRLQQASAKAVDTLERNLTCGHGGTEVRAALAILGQAMHGVELLDLAQELQELRDRIEPLSRGS